MTKTFRRTIVFIVIVAIMIAAAVSAYAVTGSIDQTDYRIFNNSLANYNIVSFRRYLGVTSHGASASNTVKWNTYTGTATQLAYCNAVTGTATVTLNGRDGDNVYIGPKSSSAYLLGQNMVSGVNCHVLQTFDNSLVYASVAVTGKIYTPDNVLMIDYSITSILP